MRSSARDEAREPEPGESAGDRQQQAFDQQLTREPPARAAERGAHRELRFAGRAAREEQARDVDARDQQQQRDSPKQDPEHAAGAADRVGLQRQHVREPLPAIAGTVPPEPGRDRREFGLRLLEGHARTEPADRAQIVVAPGIGAARLEIDGRPHVDARLQWILEAVRQDAGDAVRDAVQRQHAARGIGRAAQMIAPDARADDGDARVAAFVGALEELTQRGRDAQHAEVVGADRKRADAFGLPTIGQVRPFGRVGVQGRDVQCPAAFAKRDDDGTGQVAVDAVVPRIHADEAIRLVIRQWP